MDPTVAETGTVPEKLQNGHKKKKKTNKISSANPNQNVNSSSDNNNHCSLTEIDDVSLQIDNCHIRENGLHENGVATTTATSKKNKKKNKNKKPSPNVTSDAAAVDANLANGPTTEAVQDSIPVEPPATLAPTTSHKSTESTVLTPPLPAPSERDVLPTNEAVVAEPTEPKEKIEINYIQYESEEHMPDIMRVIQKDLSEPYSIYTYRYFIHNWPNLCFLALHETKCVGAIVCKFDMHREIRRGYIAMLAVDKDYRKLKIGTTLVQKAIKVMVDLNADEVVLETEITNKPALRLYENLGFVRDKRLFYYYLNGVDALRLKLWFR